MRNQEVTIKRGGTQAMNGRYEHRTSYRPQLEALEDRDLLTGGPPPLAFLQTLTPNLATLAMHIHAQLSVVINGQQQIVPAGVGIYPQGALPLHTHDATGLIHVESTTVYDFRLQDFFTVWGEPFGSQGVLGFVADASHPVTMTVNGQPAAALDNYVLHDGDKIVIRADETNTTTNAPAPNQAFVAQLYRDMLHREPDAAGLSSYVNRLDDDLVTRDQVVQSFQQSAEYRSYVVTDLYHRFLQRDPDSTGLQASMAFLASGGTTQQLEVSMTSSMEYFQRRGGGTNAGVLAALYQDALHRPIDSVGQSGFGAALNSGAKLSQIASWIFASPEFHENLVRDMYQRYLHRSADSGGLSYFSGALNAGAGDDNVIAGILGSGEYFQRNRA